MKALIIPAARFNRPPFRTASSHVCAPRPSLRNRRSSSCISISKAHSARLRASASPVAAASSRASEQAACMARDGGMDLLPPPRPRDARLIGCGGWELSLERAAGVVKPGTPVALLEESWEAVGRVAAVMAAVVAATTAVVVTGVAVLVEEG